MTKPVKPDDLQPLIGRAYSVLDVKAIKEDQRVIEGIATTPSTDRMGDIIEPLGIEFENPMPLLWQHDRKEPIGHATFAKATKDGIRFRARIAQNRIGESRKHRLPPDRVQFHGQRWHPLHKDRSPRAQHRYDSS
jgi:hypothetical protein